jgi:thiamine biosynthesis lipoprotein
VDANTASTAALIRGQAAPGWLARSALPARLVSREGVVETVGDWPSDPDDQPGPWAW